MIDREIDIPWHQVVRIDAARIPSPVVEDFSLTLLLDNGQHLKIRDSDSRFGKVWDDLLKNFPDLERPLTQIFTGPSDIEEHAMLWQRRSSY